MRIFGAYTDKMDSATIYVEPNNLDKIRLIMTPLGTKPDLTLADLWKSAPKMSAFVIYSK